MEDEEMKMQRPWIYATWPCTGVGHHPWVMASSGSWFGLFWICMPGTVLKRGALEPTGSCSFPMTANTRHTLKLTSELIHPGPDGWHASQLSLVLAVDRRSEAVCVCNFTSL